ncbi:MAG: MFS transporter [Dechloromonas sp.]|uniref:MFS transporter n=1 Tax=Candidatus Dechloromonas phosphorivorans TaxID=2899244 RepID=A0A935KA20_9RHOO|nr:MFS transporter [Candidatus Dechloromonas phosphorivorans]
MSDNKVMKGSGLALASVQFFFTLGWTVYATYLPELLKGAGIALTWLPWLLMADQLIFATMDIAFGVVADRVADGYRKLAHLLLWLTTVSAGAFLLLPLLASVSPGLLLVVLIIWVISASVVRAPTMVLLSKRAKAAQQGRLVASYAFGMALASALSPFLGLLLKGADPRLPFAISALTLLAAVFVLLRFSGSQPAETESDAPPPQPFNTYLPLLLVLGLATFAFQLHAFVNAGPLYLAHVAKESLPWLMPLLWLGFSAALLGVGRLVKRFGALSVAATGLLLTAIASYASVTVNTLEALIFFQVLAGAGWALAFSGLMERAAADGTRGAEGVFMGSFFAITALGSFARIGFATQYLPAMKDIQFTLPAALLLAAGAIALVYALRMPNRAC